MSTAGKPTETGGRTQVSLEGDGGVLEVVEGVASSVKWGDADTSVPGLLRGVSARPWHDTWHGVSDEPELSPGDLRKGIWRGPVAQWLQLSPGCPAKLNSESLQLLTTGPWEGHSLL